MPTPTNPTPLGLWRFDDDFTDAMGGHNLTSSASFTTGRHDSGMELNGSAAYAATYSGAVLDTSQSFTVCCWAQLTGTSEHNTFVSQSGVNVSAFFLKLHRISGKNYAEFALFTGDNIADGAAAPSSEFTIPKRGWVHLAGVYSQEDQQARLYVNGYLVDSVDATTPPYSATTEFAVGRAVYASGPVDPPTGAVDDVCVFQSALTAAEIRTVKNNWTEPAAASALATYLLDGDGTDASGNGHDLTLESGATFDTGQSGQGLVGFGSSGSGALGPTGVLDTSASFTVCCWAKVSTSSFCCFLSQQGGSYSPFYLQTSSTTPRFEIYQADAPSPLVAVAADDPVPSDVWMHLAGVYDAAAGEVRVLVNGSVAASSLTDPPNPTTGPVLLGSAWYGGSEVNPFSGAIDGVELFQAALTDEQTHDAMNNWTSAATPTISPAFFIIQNAARRLAGGGL